MAPNLFGSSATLFLEASQQDVSQEKSTAEKTVKSQKLSVQKTQSANPKYQWKIVWRNMIAFTYLHLGALYGLYILIVAAKFYTTLWGMFHLCISQELILEHCFINCNRLMCGKE